MSATVDRSRYRGAVPRSSVLRIGPVDVALVVLTALPTIGGAWTDDGSFGALQVAIVAVTTAIVLLRERAPVVLLGVAIAALLASVAISERPNGLFPTVIVLVFVIALRRERWAGVAAGAVGLVGFVGVIAILGPKELAGPQVLAAIAWPGLAAAAGDVTRNRRLVVEAAEERARRAEATREEEARRRVAEERLHIARELHDVVAHRMAVVNVQAGVAEHLMTRRPDEAADALRVVRSSARSALDELGAILNVLRAADADPPVEPAPTLDDLGALVDSFRDAGLDVAWSSSGAPNAVGESAQLAIYRMVQEALTNAHKHGDGRARVVIARSADAVQVEVVNRVADPATGLAVGSGFGLLGMRERIEAAGGRLDAGPDGSDGFRVVASVPATAVSS
jgi:signal transduction histidine kinase